MPRDDQWAAVNGPGGARELGSVTDRQGGPDECEKRVPANPRAILVKTSSPEEIARQTRMAGVRSPIKLVLAGALLIEALNLRFFAFPIDVGLPASIPWYTRVLAGQWLLLHLPGVVSLGWLDRLGLERYDTFVLFVSGYLETVLLLVVCIGLYQWFREVRMRGSEEEASSAIHD